MIEPVSFHDVEQTLETVQAKRYATYPSYKLSHIDWLGYIPEHWQILQLRRKFQIINGSTPSSGDDSYWDGDIIWITPDDLGSNNSPNIVDSRRKISNSGYQSCGTTLAPPGSLVVSTRAPIGYIGIAKVPLCTNQGCRMLVPSTILDTKYYYYHLLAAEPELVSRGRGSTFVELSKTELASVAIVWPPLEEQQTIVRFLDEQIKIIDDLIEAKRDLLFLLNEKRQAAITHAVTKGLDSNVKFIPSGIDWLGNVPEHWIVKSLKWDSPVLRGASPRPIDDPIYFDDEGEYAWVRIADVTAAGMYLEDTTQQLSELGSSLSVKLQPGELFLSIAGSVGKPCITKIKCCIHDGFVYFPRLSCDKKFLYYIFASGEPYKGLGKLGTQLNLNTDTVGSIHIAFPPGDEQKQIVNYLDVEMMKFDGLIDAVDVAIEELATLRISLISSAVTGKIDVREGAS